ncbi:MAG: hypothetical protein ACOCQD_00670, partial [archaeon]
MTIYIGEIGNLGIRTDSSKMLLEILGGIKSRELLFTGATRLAGGSPHDDSINYNTHIVIGTEASTGNIGDAGDYGHIAIGDGSTTQVNSDEDSIGQIALGYYATAAGSCSIAIGRYSNVQHLSSIALGGKATTTSDHQLSIASSECPVYEILLNGNPIYTEDGGFRVFWGDIDGEIENQTDLQEELDKKLNKDFSELPETNPDNDDIFIFEDTSGEKHIIKWSDFPGVESGGNITGELQSGQVAFGTSYNVIGGTNSFYWDNTNKRLGIGTSSPEVNLDVIGDVKFGDIIEINGVTYSWPELYEAPEEGTYLRSDAYGFLTWSSIDSDVERVIEEIDIAQALNDLTDVSIDNLNTNQALVYNSEYWVNTSLGDLAWKDVVDTDDIASSAITLSKIQDITNERILGRGQGLDGTVQELTIGPNLYFDGSELNATSNPLPDISPNVLIGRGDEENEGSYQEITLGDHLSFDETTLNVDTEEMDLEQGDGSSSYPFIIRNIHQLQKMGSGEDGWDKDRYYILGRNIDASDTQFWIEYDYWKTGVEYAVNEKVTYSIDDIDWIFECKQNHISESANSPPDETYWYKLRVSVNGFKSVGTYINPFVGSFDGLNYRIFNLNSDRGGIFGATLKTGQWQQSRVYVEGDYVLDSYNPSYLYTCISPTTGFEHPTNTDFWQYIGEYDSEPINNWDSETEYEENDLVTYEIRNL